MKVKEQQSRIEKQIKYIEEFDESRVVDYSEIFDNFT